MRIEHILRKIILRIIYGARYSEKTYINYLKKRGVKIGKNLRLFSPETITIDIQNPHLLTIGDNVRITQGCCILTHDYSYSVIAGLNGQISSGHEKVTIGSNVFVGINTIILKGSQIGDNIIIGAGSIVSGKLEDNSVYAGAPAKKIMGLMEYADKRKSCQETNAIEYVNAFRERNNCNPEISSMAEFLFLWRESVESLTLPELELVKRTGYQEKIKLALEKNNNKYEDFSRFLESVR